MIRKTKKIIARDIPVWNHLLIIIALLLPAVVAAQETNQYAGAKLTSGRMTSLIILIIGIIGLMVAYKTNKRPVYAPVVNSKRRAVMALVLGLLCIFLSAIRLVNSTGFGTGGGKAGSIVALIVGGAAIALALKVFYRHKKIKTN